MFNNSRRDFLKLWQGEAIVAEIIQPYRSGRVKFKGSYWFARSENNLLLPPETIVYVTGRVGIVLTVTLPNFST